MVNMQSTCDDALLACASQCSAFAGEYCRNVDCCHESIILSLDCAELCRQTSMFWCGKSEKTKSIALQCAETCDQLIRHLAGDTHEQARQLSEDCLKAKRCCNEIAAQSWVRKHSINHPATTVCYGITLPVSIYRA